MRRLRNTPLDALWIRFRQHGCQEARDEIIQRHIHLVDITVARYLNTTRRTLWIDRNELISDGRIGLFRAVDRFDPDRGFQFTTYAIALIRGQMVEGIRLTDWVPRSVREYEKALEAARLHLECRNGHLPTDEEIAEYLGIDATKLGQMYAAIHRTMLLSLECPTYGDGETLRLEDAVANDQNVFLMVAAACENERVTEAMACLPDRERRTVQLYYFEEKTFKQIGESLGISESRAYQLHAQALRRLRDRLGEPEA